MTRERDRFPTDHIYTIEGRKKGHIKLTLNPGSVVTIYSGDDLGHLDSPLNFLLIHCLIEYFSDSGAWATRPSNSDCA